MRIILPSRSDSKIVYWATRSYIGEMLDAGIKVYFYEGGFLHAKSLVIDNEFSTIGSTNFDFRSFDHNFEINAFMYSPETNTRMKKIFLNDMKQCKRITLSRWKRRPIYTKVVESFVRLMSPIL